MRESVQRRVSDAVIGATVQEIDALCGWPARTVAPPSDYFADAETIHGSSGTVTGSTVNATAEPGEPVHSGLSCCLNDNEHSIWYRWTAPVTGEAFFTTEGSTFDTVLRAYTSPSVDALVSQDVYWNDANPWTTWSRIELRSVTAGTTYYLAVDAANGETGAVQLNWRTTERTSDAIAPRCSSSCSRSSSSHSRSRHTAPRPTRQT